MQTFFIILACLCFCLLVAILYFVIKTREELRMHHFQFWEVREYIGKNLPPKTPNRCKCTNASEE